MEQTITLAKIIPRIRQPVLRFVASTKEALRRNLSVERVVKRNQQQQKQCTLCSHQFGAFKESRYATMSATSCELSLSLYDGIGDVVMTVYSRRSAFRRDSNCS